MLYDYVPQGIIRVDSHVTSCQGTQVRLGSQMVEESLVLAQYHFELTEEEFIIKEDGEMEASVNRISLATSCQLTQGSCVSLESVFLWTQPQQHCNFLRVHRVETRIEGNLWIDSGAGYLFNMSHPWTLNEQACPPIQIYETDIEDLYVTQDPLAVHLLKVDALNVEEDMDLLPSLKFLAHNTGKRLSLLEGRLAGNGCSLRSKFPPKEIRRWHEGGKGMFARRIGNLLQAFSCVPRVAPIVEMDSCFAEIPVLVDGKLQFIDVETLVLTCMEHKNLVTNYYR